MADDEPRTVDPLQDRAQVRIFTLADYVAEEQSGKLYISGAGLEWTGLPTSDNKIESCYLVIRLAYPRASARPSHSIVVRILDRGGNAIGPDPLLQADMNFDLHRVPDNYSEVSGTLPIQVTGYQFTVDPDDVVFFQLSVDDIVLSRLPVELLF